MLKIGILHLPTLVLVGYVIERTGVQDKWGCRQLTLGYYISKQFKKLF